MASSAPMANALRILFEAIFSLARWGCVTVPPPAPFSSMARGAAYSSGYDDELHCDLISVNSLPSGEKSDLGGGW
jgi:hypothetical protein